VPPTLVVGGFIFVGRIGEMGLPETITKRNGNVEPFDPEKIRRAVYRCMTNGLGAVAETSGAVAEDVTGRVLNILFHREINNPSVEKIQDLVIEQLWAAGKTDAAAEYTLYRMKHAEARAHVDLDPQTKELFQRNKLFFPTAIQEFQFYDKYARWMPNKGRRETWEESANRVIDFLRTETEERLGEVLSYQEWEELRQAILTMKAFPSMRVMQMAGPALRRCNVGVYNCSYIAIDSIGAFAELLYVLMQGTGAGFSVEMDYVEKLPRVKKQKGTFVEVHQVQDSTEGWCDALLLGLQHWFNGQDLQFDLSLIRPQGTILKTKGGRASGPEPLRQLLAFTREKVFSRQGRWLTTVDCHDIACMIGQIVQVGGVRRAAEISLSDLDDQEMREAKHGPFWNTAPWRTMANNSAVYESKPNILTFLEEFVSLIKSGSGERGIFNRNGILKQVPRRRKRAKFGVNPCGEIVLRSRQFCNLSIVVARPDDTPETLQYKVYLATKFGTIQSLLTRFNYLPEEWRQNCEEERLLGVDITGQFDCPILRPGMEGREELLTNLLELARDTNHALAERLKIPMSSAITCVKPSGNSAQFFNCSSGLHPRYAAYYIRRVRCAAYSPVAQFLKDEGVPWHPEYNEDPQNPQNLVFEFPIKSPEGAPTRNDLNAIQQLENWLVWKTYWTEHNPSNTIYVSEDEWLQVGNWLYEHWDSLGGLSFLPKNNHVYPLAPYEEVSKEEYERRQREFPDLDWAKLIRYEGGVDNTTTAKEFACVAGGACDI
jgi:ribonucleoside-triphosphate reductase (thioredoxin)